MNTFEFLSHLRHLNIKLSTDGERLHISAPEGILTSALRVELAERKAELLAFLHQANRATRSAHSHMIPVSRDRDLLLSFAQQRLWFLDQLEPGSSHYHISVAMSLSGILNIQALQKALNTIVERHESLRTTFLSEDGIPKQVISENWSVDLPVIDLNECPKADQEAEVQRLLRAEVQKPFNLSTDLMLRATLLRLNRKEHILLLVMHHIASDGWSMGVLWRELSILYTAFCAGQPSPLLELPVQYADFAVWQREWLQGKELEKQLTYWKQHLADAPLVLELPTDRPRPAIQTFRGATHALMLPESLSRALKKLSQQEGSTLFMTLLAAFKILLYHYTGQEDIVVGTPIANRNRGKLEDLIGFFVNTLVLRTELSGNPSFRELLARIRKAALGAYAHQDLPFEKLVEELQPERDMTHTPLFQVMFAFQNVPRQELKLSDLTVSPLKVESGTARFDLTIFIMEESEGLKVIVKYNTDLFDAVTIDRIVGHFQTLLKGIVADPAQHLLDLPLLSEAEWQQVVIEWNRTQVDYPREMCIHQLFETQLEQTPDAVAVVFEKQQLTYRELNTRANQLAHYLRKFGVGPEVLVGVYMERSLEMVIGLLGILKAGGAYVPLDPAYPKERLVFMLEDTNAPVLLTQETLKGKPGTEKRDKYTTICLDSDWQIISQESKENPVSSATADNLAYVIYTSGSTGRPKGVMVEHRSLVNYLYWVHKSLLSDKVHNFPMVTALTFDASLKQIFTMFLRGEMVWVLPGDAVIQPDTLLQVLGTRTKVGLNCVPSLWKAILDTTDSDRAIVPKKSLTSLFVGGEQLDKELVNRTFAILPHLRLLNLYGPTEATVNASAANVCPGENVSIGRPIANTQIYILDLHLQPVPIGVPGELHIGGIGLARGYLNRPGLTAEKFIPNPFSDEPGARLYKTGDLARYLPDGNIEFLGRIDHQVKIRGFRIELGEIEAVLAGHPVVREVVVIAREDKPGDKRLVAYMVSDQASSPKIHELRSFLQQKLPDYMVPSAFVMLEALPLTPNGKVDRQALPTPDQGRPEPEETFVAPRDTLESLLTKIWEKVLNIQPIGVRDNFFALGGHSLLAVRLFAHIEKRCGQSLPLATLFQSPTIEELANILRQEGWSPPWSCLVPVQPAGARIPFFCVPPAGADVIVFTDLARHLGPDQPFYGLQPLGLDGEQPPHTRVEDMAAHYIQEIQAFQPEGPYLLGGRCFGGLVAYEMACQLHEHGHRVPVLVLLESSQPPPVITLRDYVPRLFFHHLPRGQLLYCLLTDVREKVKKMSWRFSSSRMGRQIYTVWKAHEHARRAYLPIPYPVRITLFHSQEFQIRFPEYEARWSALAGGGVDCHFIPTSHHDLLREPHIQVVAERLKACFAAVDAQERSGEPIEREVELAPVRLQEVLR